MATLIGATKNRYYLTRPPRDDEELYRLVQALWGVTIPRNKVCEHHQAPFEAFATAFFAREPQVLVHGSRGLSGKTQMMSVLGLTQAVVLGADNNIVGGSEQQAKNALEHMSKAWAHPDAPEYMLKRDGTQQMTLTNQAIIRPLTASQRSVRGPHPARLLLDEIDEMDAEILESAKGQPMPQKNWLGVEIPAQTTMVSTLQYSDGTMVKEMARFEEEGLPVMSWCVASDSLVTTARGQVPVQEVTDQDLVLTRNGFRHVQHVTFMGHKPTLRLDVGDQSLYVTGDHRVATPDGWSDASALAADAMSSVRPDPRVLGGELVPLSAVRGPVLVPPRTGLVLGVGDEVEVLDVDTGAVTAQVIRDESFLDGAYYVLPHPTMGLDHAALDVLSAVPVALESRPVDAASGEHGHIVLPVWDIGVEGDDHEFLVNGVLVHNCYKDTANPVDGWLSQEFIEQKRREVSRERWRVEYDLGEPSIGNRAFDSSAVERMFADKAPEPVRITREYEEYSIAEARNDRDYVISADWAQAIDWTEIHVYDVTSQPIELVYRVRMQRMPYPRMIGVFNMLQKRYRAEGIHDATGLGRVVSDMLDERVRNFVMAGRERDNMLSEYVGAVERGQIKAPRMNSMYKEHLFCSVEDLYARGKEYHLPDSVCAAGLAWKMVGHKFPVVDPVGLGKGENWMAKHVANNTSMLAKDSPYHLEGEVRSSEDVDELSFT